MLTIGKKYKVKTEQQLIDSGWTKTHSDVFTYIDDVSIVEDMLMFETVTILNPVGEDMEAYSVKEDGGRFYWTKNMLLDIVIVKRNLPDWF